MNLIAQRNQEGMVSLSKGKRTIKAKIPQTRSMIGIIGINGLIPDAEYRENGMVYLNNKPIRKWHVRVKDIRLWEPKLKNLKSLYKLYKETQEISREKWKKGMEVIDKLWKGHKVGDEVKAHAFPSKHGDHSKADPDWWEYHITDSGDGYGVRFGFNWTRGKPLKLINHDLGQKFYEIEQRDYDLRNRTYKVQTIFYEAMKKSLPKATEGKSLVLQFDKDSYWFYTVSRGPGICWWEMFNDAFKIETKRIV